MRIFSVLRSGVRRWVVVSLGALCATASANVLSQDFTLAMSASPTAMDPHFYTLTPNVEVSGHLFDKLVVLDADSRVVPALAESWSLINNLTWEFKLRKGVKFHDGSELTAEDVAWSMARPATIVGSPGKFDTYTAAIINTNVVDPYTIRFTTKVPHPLMLSDLTTIFIVSKKATQGLSSEDFNSGKGMVGTGPFKFVRFLRGDRVELERNDGYWGNKAAWTKVTLRFIPNDATRLAALLAGDVQAISNVPTPDLPKVRSDKNIAFFSKVAHRVIFVYLDAVRSQSPFITGKDGKPLDKNPLQNAQVRKAMSLAINRELIKERVMEGLAEPTNNLVPQTLFGHNPNLKLVKADPDGAKKLLAKAGYPDGFGMSIHTPNNRYVNDEKIAQTIAQMWTRIGITTRVESSPYNAYLARATKGEISAGLHGWGAQTGEVSQPLRSLAACVDPTKAMGGSNRLKYCNPKMDELLVKGLSTMDDKARLKLLQEATAVVIEDGAFIPLHFHVATWAMKRGISFTPRTDELTFAQDFRAN